MPQSSILAFRSCALRNAREIKQYLERSGGVTDNPDVAKELTDRVNGVMGDDDEAGAAAPAEGGSASEDGGGACGPR